MFQEVLSNNMILIVSCMIILYIVEKGFCRYYLQTFSIKEILKSHINNCFKIDDRQMIQMPKEGEYVKFKNY